MLIINILSIHRLAACDGLVIIEDSRGGGGVL